MIIYWDYYDYDTGSFNLYAHWMEYDSDTQVVVNWDGDIQVYDKGTTIDLDISDKREYEDLIATVTFSTNRQTYSDYDLNIIKKYTRDHYLIDGEAHIDTGEYTFNSDTIIETVYTSEIIYPDVPVIENSNFLGWYEGNIDVPVTSVVGVYTNKYYSGKWKKVKVYVDGELKRENQDVGLYDLPYTYFNPGSYVKFVYNQYVNYIPSTEKLWIYPIYEFEGFSVDGNDAVKYKDDELYDYEEDTYFLSHYKFTGEYSPNETFDELKNNNFDLGRTTDWGNGGTVYYLEGWYTYLGDGGVKVDLRTDPSYLKRNGSNYYSPLTLYAKWLPLIENVNVTINDDEPYVQEFGEHQLIPDEKEVNTTKTSDTFNITFDYNDGTNNKIITQVSRNYEFECFTVDGAGCYQRDDNYTFYQDTEIKNKYTISYTYPEMDMPEIDDPTFIGWFTKPTGGVEITDVSQLEEFKDDTVIYAQYYSGTVHLNFDGVETDVPQGTIITFEDKDPFDESITLTLDYNQDGLENKILHYTTTYTVDYYQVNPINEWFEAYPGDVYVIEKDTTINTNYNTSLNHDFVGYDNDNWDYGMIYYDSDDLANRLDGWETLVCGYGGGGGEIGPKSIRNSINDLYGNSFLERPGKIDLNDEGNCWNDYVDLDYLNFDQVKDGSTITASWSRPDGIVYFYDTIENTNLDSSWYIVGNTIDWLPDYYDKDGYIFDGWYLDDTFTEKVTYDYIIKKTETTLYGHWIENHSEDPEKSLIIKPDETSEEVEKGTIYNLGTNNIYKADNNIATVYFVPDYDDETQYITDYVKKRYTPNGWLVNDVYYEDGQSIDCQDDIIIIRPNYDIELISPTFPEPTKDNYTLDGWYDYLNAGTQYTEYTGETDRVFYAHWIGAEVSVTKPDNSVEIYHYGDEYNLGTNDIEKENENIASVTFKYQDGRDDTVSYITKSFIPDKWKVNDIEEENDTVLTLTEDIVIEATYEEEINELVFEEPVREHYTFDGWYDSSENQITSYNGNNNITVYAHWTGDEVTVTKPNLEVETYHYGDTYELGENKIEKASINLGSVTFKYQDLVTADTIEFVKRKYTPNGWLVNEIEKEDNQILVLTENIVITPNYTDEIEPVIFEDAERNNYTFDGWFDEEENGIKINLQNLAKISSIDKELIESMVNSKTNEKCDFEKTTVTIYPKTPYGKTDYELKVNLDCGFDVKKDDKK